MNHTLEKITNINIKDNGMIHTLAVKRHALHSPSLAR